MSTVTGQDLLSDMDVASGSKNSFQGRDERLTTVPISKHNRRAFFLDSAESGSSLTLSPKFGRGWWHYDPHGFKAPYHFCASSCVALAAARKIEKTPEDYRRR